MAEKDDFLGEIQVPKVEEQESRDEQINEVTGLSEDIGRMQRLADEIDVLKDMCRELICINRDQKEQLARQVEPSKPLLKPRDIPVLELDQLKGVAGEGRLSIFLSQLEECAFSTHDRLRMVTTRVDVHLAIYVQAILARNPGITWEEFKKHLKEELTEQNEDNIFDAINSLKYQVEEDPTEFVAHLKCKLALLELRTNGKETPSKEKIIKTKLMQGLPKASRERLELFKDPNVSLKRFMDRFSLERTIVLAQITEVRSVQASPTTTPEKDETSKRLDEMESRLRRMNTQGTVNRNKSYSQYCRYCRSSSHGEDTCRRNPRPGSCFDCLRTNCYRGHPRCEGRINQTR